MIELRGLGLKFGNQVVLSELSAHIPQSQITILLGPSGSGKSSLLRVLAGLEKETSGSILWPEQKKPTTSMVFQEAELLPWLTAEENACFAQKIQTGKSKTGLDIGKLMSELGLLGAKSKYPHQLSGGMKMRVSLARALSTRPQLLLLDEPFAALDEITRESLQDLLLTQVQQDPELTTVFVTHSLAEALYLGDQILTLSRKGELEIHPSIPRFQNRSAPEFLAAVAEWRHKIKEAFE